MAQAGNSWRHLLPGVILIALGALFLFNPGYVERVFWHLETWWPMILVVLGVIQLLKRPRRWVGAFVLMAIGVILQVDRLDIFPWWSMHRMWPLILIVIGLAMIAARIQGATSNVPRDGAGPANPGGSEVKS